MLRLFAGLAALVPLMWSTTAAAPVPKHLMKEPPLYYPTRVGAKWVYQIGKEELVLSVSAVEPTDTGLLVSITNHRPNGRTFLDQKMLVTPAGVTQIESFEGKLDSPWCWLKIPCVIGQKWESDCSNDVFVQKWECTTLGTEEVEVPAGKFTAVRVHTKLVVTRREGGPLPIGSVISSVEWYAPGVGVVKVEPSPGSTRVLKSFTP
ncbi:Uncharacterized protein OS=Meiothermus silvanus (strain ATCC 700542 / DSM 9946 / VI-R2) GN=Mesil_1810 PE=4 SV=1: DUF3108 [Gemmata massiliana]|uniref:DUF3108 domain-containing protein n=1 Tax=Gemmata massiliana TaxID=1210884 RepID=A0A6P2CYN7_9BACT|nr:hypothetical protein [Gemmata massiliana]VTR93235.1 Uncharacterized protein OS=Meiothermus silvanus (strain ATCC 700542 / DSM 9946 / VI-R2) GN=Mesil_1810 PE=4 SV=1: DUF3108 [Gemmata massiliana]